MVSFSCENCGDVLTKKKLDPHRNQCRGASFTCLDCMVHFYGTEYRSHTSCISEAQKYQGSTYKDKKKGNQHKQQDYQNTALVPHAYVEDVHDASVAIVDAPPRAPSPPVNVFDFLVEDKTPNASRVALPDADESRMIEDAPERQDPDAATKASRDLVPRGFHDHHVPGAYDSQEAYADTGVSYGHTPVAPSFERFNSFGAPNAPQNYTTPAPKFREVRPRPDSKHMPPPSTDKKRKRASPNPLDMHAVHALNASDILMTDAPPELHSGLTGGLSRMLKFPPSPDYSPDWVDADKSPLSPKRARNTERGRERERRKSASKGRAVQLVQVRKRAKRGSGDRERERERDGTEERRRRRKRGSDEGSSGDHSRAVKRIEYRVGSHGSSSNGDSRALVLHKSEDLKVTAHRREGDEPFAAARADLFMGFVNKGPESASGMSVNKALKRYHRERSERWDDGEEWGGMSKGEEEKELWKSLRVRRNDRGEIVLFF